MDPAIGYVFAVIFVLIGLVGMVLPALPGVPMIFAGLLLAAWSGDFEQIGGFTIFVLAALTLAAVVVDIIASAFGTRIAGASRWAFFGAAVGAVIGLFFGLPGLLLGPFVGALALEWLQSRDLGKAALAGGGATLGLIIGAAIKIAIAFTMLGVFAFAWWID